MCVYGKISIECVYEAERYKFKLLSLQISSDIYSASISDSSI